GARLKDVAASCNLAAPTASRFLSNLTELGYIKQNHLGHTVSPRLAALSRGTYTIDTHASIQEVLRLLADQSNLTAFFVVHDADEAVYVQRAIPINSSLINTQRIGHRAPLYCTGVGKVFLSSWDDGEIAQYCKRTKMEKLTHKTIVDELSLMKLLETTRETGFALDDEECEIGVKCVAVPVRNMQQEVKASLSISGAASLFDEAGISSFHRLLQNASQQIGTMQGQEDTAW
ncbi:MAG: IclR family transcriptional regulator, partial [Planctomycetes bacterium]|nr:IclR family transcriptional regulator [Planctomycetota bacterium]